MKTARRINIALVLAIAAATMAGWAATNQPRVEPLWPASVSGFAFSPLRRGQIPSQGEFPSTGEIDADLALLARSTGAIRSYSLDGIYGTIPNRAARHGLDVTVGVELDGDRHRNETRVEQLSIVAAQSSNVRRAIIGNETLLSETLTIGELEALLALARSQAPVAVSTAEPWHIWLQYPELADHVDFIVVHLLPYWEGIGIDDAVGHVVSRMELLEAMFPDKPIVIGEVGWPSYGRTRDKAVASPANAATFLRRFLRTAHEKGYEYFLMEAFDQPWKRSDEGDAGAYWGVYDVDRVPKYELTGPIARLPGWQTHALLATLLASLAFGLLTADGCRLRGTGRAFMAATAAALATATVWCSSIYAPRYWTALDALGAVLLLLGLLGVVILVLVEAHEWAEAAWSARARRATSPRRFGESRLPKVSIHVPTYQEPPALLAETLRALAALDYPRFEVIVVDNNTQDERLWKPVEALCASLGERFRFFHVDPLSGYKAGALNFALRRTARDARIVAVIDSDYKVDRRWLRDLVPHFADPAVAIVQAPQDYRDGGEGLFKTMCNAEYQGFFRIGMITRNDRNAIIQHGTMTMIRERVLREVGGWDASTITEDAELGLRVLEHGHAALYLPKSYGKGLTPDNFHDYKVQRFRWALGATQILRKHRASLLGTRPSALTLGQRYHFVAGWLPWLADGLNLFFNGVAILWSLALMLAPLRLHPPVAALSAFVIALFVFKLVKLLALYRSQVGVGLWRTLGAVLAGLGLVYTVGSAVIAGLAGRETPFVRTPKLAHRHRVGGALAAAAPEAALATLLLASAIGVAGTAPYPSIDTTLWCWLLAVFALPHLAAVATSLASALPQLEARPAEQDLNSGSNRGFLLPPSKLLAQRRKPRFDPEFETRRG